MQNKAIKEFPSMPAQEIKPLYKLIQKDIKNRPHNTGIRQCIPRNNHGLMEIFVKAWLV